MPKSLFRWACGLLVSLSSVTALAQAPYQPGATAGYYPLAVQPIGVPVASQMPMMGAAQYAPAPSAMMAPSVFMPPGMAPAAPPVAMMPGYAPAGCGSEGCGEACCGQPRGAWYGGIGALYMARTRTNPLHFSFEPSTPGICRLQGDNPALFSPMWGGEVMIGRRIGCCQNGALEGVYWALDPMDERLYASVPGFFLNTGIGLNNPIGGPALEIDGNTLDFWFDGAQQHLLERRNEVHNVEANALFWAAPATPEYRLSLAILGGFRYFRFDEGLLFGALRPGGNWGGNGGLDEAYMDVDVTNDLIGGQLGARAQFAISDRIALFAGPKVGIFGNSMEQHYQIYRGDGLHALDLSSTEGTVSVMGQLDAGVNVYFTRRVSGYVGYRILGISGIAQADNQVVQNVHFTEEILDIGASGDLFLHGLMFGLMYNY